MAATWRPGLDRRGASRPRSGPMCGGPRRVQSAGSYATRGVRNVIVVRHACRRGAIDRGVAGRYATPLVWSCGGLCSMRSCSRHVAPRFTRSPATRGATSAFTPGATWRLGFALVRHAGAVLFRGSATWRLRVAPRTPRLEAWRLPSWRGGPKRHASSCRGALSLVVVRAWRC